MKLRLVELTKSFFSRHGSVLAVNNVNLEINSGEFFVLLGPSGCGKSTMLNLIAGLEKPTKGEIWFDETLVASASKKVFLPPKARNVAMVFQSYALYPHLSVFENIAFPMRISRTKEHLIKESVQRVASMLAISELLDRKPGELSGGQRQRVAIARAIVRKPNVFLLDEPLSNLDAQLRASTRGELKNLQRNLGITTLYVTHDQIEAMSLGDRIAVLKDGKIVQIGTPDDLYESPVNPFVATFIGSPPMNLLKSSISYDKGSFFITVGNTKIKLPENKAKKIKGLKSKDCLIGIRPEHIYINPTSAKQTLKGKITSIEPLGKDLLLHISIGENEFTAVSSKKRFKEFEIVDVEFDTEKIHIFEIQD